VLSFRRLRSTVADTWQSNNGIHTGVQTISLSQSLFLWIAENALYIVLAISLV
jgi:hypothetical protein